MLARLLTLYLQVFSRSLKPHIPALPDANDSLNLSVLSGLTILTQNCDSLNLSTFKNDGSVKVFNKKMEAILSSGADIILLCDIRAKSHSKIIADYIQCTDRGGYKIIINSLTSKRGVAVLYKASLDLIATDVYKSDCFNVCLVNCVLNGLEICIGSVYGPTDTQDRLFYTNLRKKLVDFVKGIFLIGGDFNAITSIIQPTQNSNLVNIANKTYDNLNPELLYMSRIPNPMHTEQIVDGIIDDFWCDPFRALYVDKRDFSFVPRINNSINRSRIDFFLMSSQLLDIVQDVSYLHLTSEFDHKACKLKFSTKNVLKSPIIDSNLLSFPGVREIATREALSIIDTYSDVDIQQTFANYSKVCKSICDLQLFYLRNESNDKLIRQIVIDKVQQCFEIKTSLPEIDIMFEYEMSEPHDLIQETLQNNIKINVVSYQKGLRKAKSKTLLSLQNRLKALKDNSESKIIEIYNLEKQILDYNDNLIRLKCYKSRSWRIINLEKASKRFCALSKTKKKSDSLDVVSDVSDPQNPIPFNNSAERNEHIAKFYEKIYSKGPSAGPDIEGFLGNDICSSDYVREKKLTINERNSLERPISCNELDCAIKKSNKFSASGADGWSYSSIFFFWDIFRTPVKNSFNVMVAKGSLQYSSRIVNLKIIPKKENLESIANWRPISLMSCFYKLCSSAYAERLRIFYDKIVSQRQKAYSKNKVIHEAVINVLDSIHKANYFNSNMCIIAIDFKKAFDSVGHDFILATLKYFGFGPIMINIARTILSGRVGGIITAEGLTRLFFFLSGSGQGDPVSTYFFCFCVEILLIKLKLCPSLQKVYVPNPHYADNRETLEIAAFADDISELTYASEENITNIKLILNNFFRISDLEINAGKTCIIPCGAADTPDFQEIVENAGFSHDRVFKLLGFEITNNLHNMRINVIKCIKKITSIIDFWSKFSLSTAGRVNIYKTMILSQIGYICCITNTSISDCNLIDRLVFKFCTKNLNISFKTAFSSPSENGLGLIHTNEYILALRVGLFRRHLKNEDTWSKAITYSEKCSNNRYIIDFNSDILRLNPCAKLIADAFKTFFFAFNRVEGNFLKAPLFENFSLFRDNLNSPFFIRNLSVRTQTDFWHLIPGVRLFDVVNLHGPNLKTKPRMENSIGFPITDHDFRIICIFVSRIIDCRRNDFFKMSSSIVTFFEKITRGSKPFRKIISDDRRSKVFFKDHLLLHRIEKANTFLQNNLDPINFKTNSFYNTWSQNFIPHKDKEIFFKYTHNRLVFNDQLSKFEESISKKCILCARNNVINAKNDNFFHLVYECRFYSPLVDYFVTSMRSIEENFCKSNILFGSTHETPWLRSFCNVNVLFFISFSYQRTRTKLTPTQQILGNSLYSYLEASKSASVTFERAHINVKKKFTFPNDSWLNLVHTIL